MIGGKQGYGIGEGGSSNPPWPTNCKLMQKEYGQFFMSETLRLFDEFERTDASPAKYSESIFDALNRLSWKNAVRIRDVLEDWFSTHPPENKQDLVRRFRSNRDDQHQGAFFELFLRKFLTRLEYTVTVNPSMSSGMTPDFFVASTSGEEFYLEATVAEPKTLRDSPSEEQSLDELSKLQCPDYWLFPKVRGVLHSTPPLKKMRQTFQGWIDELSYETVKDTSRSRKYPSCSFTHAGWALTLTAIPRGEAHRGKPGARPLADISRADFVDSAKPIWNAAHEKAKKYKALGAPFIVAINTLDRAGVDRLDVLLALFGWEGSTDEPDLARISPLRGERKRDWLWDANKNTGVSAILLFNELYPSAMASAPVCLYENPWASHPVPASLQRLPHAIADGEFMRWHPGETLGAILSLPADWPGPK